MTGRFAPWTVAVMAVTVGLVGLGFALPWYSYHFSTGTRDPPGGAEPDPDTSIEHRDIYYLPFQLRGNATDEDRKNATQPLQILGGLAAGGLFFGVFNLASEIVFGYRETTRRIQLVLSAAAFACTAGAAAYAWFTLPPLLADAGVDAVFTYRRYMGGFLQTTPSWGWSAAMVSLVGHVAGFAFKYAGGPFDYTLVESYRKARQ